MGLQEMLYITKWGKSGLTVYFMLYVPVTSSFLSGGKIYLKKSGEQRWSHNK